MSHLRLQVQELEARLAEEWRRHAETEALWKEEQRKSIETLARVESI